MHAGLGFGNRAVVDLDLGWLAFDEQALDSLAAGGDQNALGDRVGIRTHRDRNFSGGVAAIGHVDGHQPVARRGRGGVGAQDSQVGQALVRINPIGEEPGEVAAGSGLFEERKKERSGILEPGCCTDLRMMVWPPI